MHKALKGIMWFASVVALIAGVAISFHALTYQKEPIELMSVARDEVSLERIYKLNDIMLVDTYASRESGRDAGHTYMLVTCFEGTELISFSLMLDMQDPLYTQLVEYYQDETASYGGFSTSCYAYLTENIAYDDQKTYYEQAVQHYKDALQEIDIACHTTYWDFEYICPADEDYKEYANRKTLEAFGMAALCIAIAGGMAFFAVKWPQNEDTALRTMQLRMRKSL